MSESVSEQEIKFIEVLCKHENARDLLKAYFKGMAEAQGRLRRWLKLLILKLIVYIQLRGENKVRRRKSTLMLEWLNPQLMKTAEGSQRRKENNAKNGS